MGYILDLYRSNIKEIKLSDASFWTLYQFTKSECMSTYQVCNLLKNSDYESEYKNVHKKVKKLLSLKLIKKVPKNFENLKHGAIYYKLTSTGVFYLVSQLMKYNADLQIINYWGDDDFFKFFVYPYFERKTLQMLKFPHIVYDILRYFRDCCKVITEFFDEELVTVEKNYGVRYLVDFWNQLPIYTKEDDDLERFMSFLRKQFNLNWLDLDSKIKRIDDYTITISKHKRILYLKLNQSRTKASLLYENKKLYEYEIEPFEDDLIIFVFEKKSLEQAISDENNYLTRIKELVENLSLNLVKYSVPKYAHRIAEKERGGDAVLLSNDTKFLQVLISTKSKYDEYYSNFLSLIGNKQST